MPKPKNQDFSALQTTFLEYQQKAGQIDYVACFGKTFLHENTPEYQLAQGAAALIIQHGFGVLHGAYAGVMQAVSQGADAQIQKGIGNPYWNIGVPLSYVDQELKRSSAINLPAADNLSTRKRALVEFCHICVVLPSGGFGTILETLEVFHQNQHALKFGGKITPLILIGGNWKQIFEFLYQKLNMQNQDKGQSFTYFIDSLSELDHILNQLKQQDE